MMFVPHKKHLWASKACYGDGSNFTFNTLEKLILEGSTHSAVKHDGLRGPEFDIVIFPTHMSLVFSGVNNKPERKVA
jgi:hypothetical protein